MSDPSPPSLDSPNDDERLLLPGEVAKLFRVDPKTVARWAKANRIPHLRTPGGHTRFRWRVIRALLHPSQPTEEVPS